GLSPVLYVTIGSGIGGGLVVDGSIYSGSGRGAVEIGHLRTWRNGAGNDQEPPTVESIASGWGLERRGRDVFGIEPDEPFSAEDVVRRAREGDSQAGDLLKVSTDCLAEALAHAVTLLAPRRVILGGGVSMIGEALWFEPIRREVDRLVFPPYRGRFDVVPAALGEAVVVRGALALANEAADN
ncbi:MAG TPA: ROK family protein, partial [Isosphaeraceae bacterium]|nr:ROK family protein [Isosphaeraceae bacterium]